MNSDLLNALPVVAATPACVKYGGPLHWHPSHCDGTRLEYDATLGHRGERRGNTKIHLGRDEQEFTDKLLRYDYEMWVQHYSTFYDGIPKFDTQAATLQSMKDSGIFLGGTVEQLKAEWRHIYASLPCEYITLIWHYARCPKELMLEELGVFMTEVLPELDAPASDDG